MTQLPNIPRGRNIQSPKDLPGGVSQYPDSPLGTGIMCHAHPGRTCDAVGSHCGHVGMGRCYQNGS